MACQPSRQAPRSLPVHAARCRKCRRVTALPGQRAGLVCLIPALDRDDYKKLDEYYAALQVREYRRAAQAGSRSRYRRQHSHVRLRTHR
jgi:hypothetical protein